MTRVQPTEFPELNDLLAELTDRAATILGDNLVGVYLQGSFAVGDADLASDCDFLVPVHRQVTADQEQALRELHDEIPTRDGFWCRHLEGSYPVAEELRTLAGLGCPWLYVDHGWREMQWATHCNNVVARWSLRERGVTLTGPEPSSVVDPVPSEEMRAYARAVPEHVLDRLPHLDDPRRRVGSAVRRHDLLPVPRHPRHGRGAVEEGRPAVGPGTPRRAVAGLLQQVSADRAAYDADEPSRPGSAEQTREFARYCEGLSAQGGSVRG